MIDGKLQPLIEALTTYYQGRENEAGSGQRGLKDEPGGAREARVGMSGLDETIGSALADRYIVNSARVRELASSLTDQQFWQKPFPFGNSFGHLVRHLTGNLNYYIGAQIAGTEYVRDRPRNSMSRISLPKKKPSNVLMKLSRWFSRPSKLKRRTNGLADVHRSSLKCHDPLRHDSAKRGSYAAPHRSDDLSRSRMETTGRKANDKSEQPGFGVCHLRCMSKESSRSLIALAGFGLATAGAAWFGARYSPSNGNRDAWYRELDKPSFTPPDKVFPVVWTSLYALIAWSGWRIWSAAPSRERNAALRLWISQLAANAQWSKLFFGDRRPTPPWRTCWHWKA